MNDALRMQISAYVDGELPENESELLLRRLSQDAAMRAQVATYLALGRAVRQDQDHPEIDQLRSRVANALGDESFVETAPKPEVGSGLMTPAGGIAVAATVAAIALVGLSQIGGPITDTLPDAVAIDLAPVYTEPTDAQMLANRPSERLLEYSRRHDDSSADLGSSDIISRMVTFELRAGELVEIEPDPRLLSEKTAQDDEAAE